MSATDRVDGIAVITRLHYGKGDPQFELRKEMFKRYALASLLRQTDQDFDIWVWAEPWHKKEIEELVPGVKINVFAAEWRKRTGEGTHNYFIDYTGFDKTEGLPKYTTVVGLDSDDELDPSAIATIRRHHEMQPDRNFAISFQPIKRDLTTEKKYRMKSYEKRGKMAPIFALHQPNDPYLFAYQYGHYSEMPRQFTQIIYVPEGQTYLNVHDFNASTKVIPKEDQEILDGR